MQNNNCFLRKGHTARHGQKKLNQFLLFNETIKFVRNGKQLFEPVSFYTKKEFICSFILNYSLLQINFDSNIFLIIIAPLFILRSF